MSLSSAQMAPSIAIIGSGPAGCYAAHFLRRTWPAADITIFEALPVPYGLVRYGIAPDHQGAKLVTAQFERLFEREMVRFVGNVRVGRDIDLSDLSKSFDIIIMATGLSNDRLLPVPVAVGAHVCGAGAFIRQLNGYPVLAENTGRPEQAIGSEIAVVGMGNVAIDVVRLLSKHEAAFTGSDVDSTALEELRSDVVTSVVVLGRSPARHAKFDLAMFRELCGLPNVDVTVVGDVDGADSILQVISEANADKLRARDAGMCDAARTKISFHFGVSPTEIGFENGKTRLSGRCEQPAQKVEFLVDTVITAIGFEEDSFNSEKISKIQDKLENAYSVGWACTGPVGTVAANRANARSVVKSIEKAFSDGVLNAGKPGFAYIEPALPESRVDYAGWKRIDDLERSSAPEGRARKKITRVDQMLLVACPMRSVC